MLHEEILLSYATQLLIMKKNLFIFLLILTAAVLPATAQRYASRMTVDGTIYFIDPIKLKQLENIKKFEYDVTLLSWTDSVTVNFTFESERMTKPESLKLISCGKTFECKDFSTLFIDLKKKHYEVRITSKFPSEALKEIFECENSPTFVFTQDNITEKASYKSGSWKKDRKKLIDIYGLYQYSKTIQK